MTEQHPHRPIAPANASPPTSGSALPTFDEMVERCDFAIEGEFGGLAASREQCEEIVAFIVTGMPPTAERDAALARLAQPGAGGAAEPDPLDALLALPCDAQHEAAARIAANIGYELVPEKAPDLEPGQPVRIAYTNWRGEPTTPTIMPTRVFWGSNEWHPEPCWLLEALDVGKGALRTFDLRKIRAEVGAARADGGAVREAVRAVLRVWRDVAIELPIELELALGTLETAALAAPGAEGPAGDGWRPIETAPQGKMLVTYRLGEEDVARAALRVWPDGDREWIAPDGRTTVTHHSYAPPTHWLCEAPELPAPPAAQPREDRT